jgi:hypothetical protein
MALSDLLHLVIVVLALAIVVKRDVRIYERQKTQRRTVRRVSHAKSVRPAVSTPVEEDWIVAAKAALHQNQKTPRPVRLIKP